jgi:hypothetical protein
MQIRQGTKVEVKGNFSGHWKVCIAREDFDTGDQRWKLYDQEAKNDFDPLSDRCKIRIIHEDGSRQNIKYLKDSEVWDVIKDQISKSKIKRYSWELIFGESLTKTILRLKMKGLSAVETYHVIIEHPMIKKITNFFPDQKERLHEKIYISVNARYGENDTALKLYNKEFKK